MTSVQPSLKSSFELPGVGSSVEAVRQAAPSLHEFLDGKTEAPKSKETSSKIDPYKKP